MNVFNQMISVMKTLQESQESQMEQITANLTSTTETAQANKYFLWIALNNGQLGSKNNIAWSVSLFLRLQIKIGVQV